MALTYTFRDGTTTTDTIAWAMKYEDRDYRQVKTTKISEDDKTFVSTIWQGLPSISENEPNVFETAYCQDVDGDVRIIHYERSWTEEEALITHEDFVELARLGAMEAFRDR